MPLISDEQNEQILEEFEEPGRAQKTLDPRGLPWSYCEQVSGGVLLRHGKGWGLLPRERDVRVPIRFSEASLSRARSHRP